MASTEPPVLNLEVNGEAVAVADRGWSLLDVLRHHLGLTSVKDGCSPQGQCGCCTVLVDGNPRVACVTPARRCRGRSVVTLEGLDPERRRCWGEVFCATGASQCGFCTPGIIVRLDAIDRRAAEAEPAGEMAGEVAEGGETDRSEEMVAVETGLLAHLCRCTGWQTIGEAYQRFRPTLAGASSGGDDGPADRDLDGASHRASIEGRTEQQASPEVCLGAGGFAGDTAPPDCLIAVRDGQGHWAVGETLAEAREVAGKVQGRRTTAPLRHPLEIPPGRWEATVRTTWVDGAYLETDASWCAPGGVPASVVANGGAFGAKVAGSSDQGELDVATAARTLADRHGRSVLVLASREDVARFSPKRPPVAGAMAADGTGILRIVGSPELADELAPSVAHVAPGLVIEPVSVPGPPVSAQVRAAGWAEAAVLAAGVRGRIEPVRSPEGAEAMATISDTGAIRASVRCGQILDPIVLRSYCIGAAHMAWSWLTSEALVVDADGVVHDLTVRSFGVLRAIDTPPIEIELLADDGPPINGSDAVFAAVAAAGWLALDCRQDWPITER